MSVYICDGCENYFDDDYEGCFEHPHNPCVALCEECHMELTGEE